MDPISTAYEEKALLGKVGLKFDTPEKVTRLKVFRYQSALANHLLFSQLLPERKLDEIARLIGFNSKPKIGQEEVE